MTEPSAKLKEALAQVQAPWDEARTERTLHVLPRRRRTRRVRVAFGAGAFAGLSVACMLLFLHRPDARHGDAHTEDARGATHTGARRALTPGQQLRLSDGSEVSLLDARTDVVVDESSARRVALRVGGGRARMDVPALPERAFELHTAQIACRVLGAVFEVAQQTESTWLRVERGRVLVTSVVPPRALEAGEEAWFPSPPSTQSSPPVPADKQTAASPKPAARPALRSPALAEPGAYSWRDHAESGDFKQAFPLLPSADATAAMSVSELMLAADAARLSGHPEAALPYLRRVVTQHAQDPRAPLAAFTLGGVLMNQLGMPREAEAAYAKARATSLSAALAQDALARQVEAAHRAGDEALARNLAREYLQSYPQGRRVHAVRRFGGL
jgi:transmembrane sensor